MIALGMAAAGLVWLIPGLAVARWLRLVPTGDRALDAAVGILAAAAVSMTAALACWLVGFPADRFDRVLVLVAALSLFAFGKRFRTGEESPPPAAAAWAVLVTVVGLAVAGYLVGGSARWSGDGPDHMGTLREILASGSFFPTEAFHRDAGLLGADARKGLLHPVLAALAHLVRLDPVDFWLHLPALTAPATFLAAYGFLRLGGLGPGWAAGGAWIFLVSWSGGLGREFLRLSGYPNQFGAAVFWLAAGASLRAVRGGLPWAAAAGLGAFAAVAVHPMYSVFTAWFGALLLAYVLAARRDRAAWTRLAVIAACAAPLAGVYLLARLGSYAPGNPLHTELQGMLLFGDSLFVADPLLLLSHVGWAGPVAYAAVLVVLWRRRRRDPLVFLVFWGTVSMLFLTLNPLLVPFLQRHLTYLVFRSFWFLPPGLAAAVVLHDAWTRPGRGKLVVTAALALGLLPGAAAAARVDRWVARGEDPRVAALPWRDALRELDASLPPRSVVASDPVTSYVLPAFTSLKVVCTLDQHSPPNDSLCVERLTAARDVLSPSVSPGEAWETARAHGASYVLLNRRLSGSPELAAWAFSAGEADRRARQLAASAGFRERPAPEGFRVFEIVPPRPPATARGAERWETVPADTVLVEAGLALIAASVAPDTAAAGDAFRVRLAWAGMPGAEPRRRSVFLRFDHLDAAGGRGPFSKLWRKFRERRDGVRYRFRVDTAPGGGAASPERFTEGMAATDTVTARIPGDAAPGRWAVSVRVAALPIMPNHRLGDYLSDDDLYAGTPVDTVAVGPAVIPPRR